VDGGRGQRLKVEDDVTDEQDDDDGEDEAHDEHRMT
jgi:hypothetical protein